MFIIISISKQSICYGYKGIKVIHEGKGAEKMKKWIFIVIGILVVGSAGYGFMSLNQTTTINSL